MSLIDKWLKGSFDRLYPNKILATLAAKCVLSCLHCYWRHDIAEKQDREIDWQKIADRCKSLGKTQLFYCGRILNDTGARFLNLYYKKTNQKPSIIDNGWTILEYPELLAVYDQISVSIDGWKDAHDWQRNKNGAFDKTWKTVMELKSQGLDPVVASALSPVTMQDWDKFEKLLIEHNVPLSSTLVWDLPETAKRKKTVLNTQQIIQGFNLLIGGMPKLINLYSIEHIKILTPILKRFDWQPQDDHWLAVLPSGTKVVYRPPSVVAAAEVDLLWDGKFYTSMAGRKICLIEKVDESYFKEIDNMRREEVEVWSRVVG